MSIRMLLAPLIGGVIGYITNDIAIKMLFRPRKAIYIGKWKLPFTPGLIPQQKDRIAHSIGNVVSGQLLNAETLRAAVLSEENLTLLRDKLTGWFTSFAHSEDTVESFAARCLGEDTFQNAADSLETGIEQLLIQKVQESDIGAAIMDRCMDMLKDNLGLGGGLQAFLFGPDFLGQIENALASAINDLVRQFAPDLIHSEVHKSSIELREKQLCDLYYEHQLEIPELVEHLLVLYQKILGENIEKIVQAVDISGIICKKISAFDAAELENLIFGIMKRELRAIVYLGALLGFLMGSINILFL